MKAYEVLADDQPAEAILNSVLESAQTAGFYVPRTPQQLWDVCDKAKEFHAKARGFRHNGFGFEGGKNCKSEYLVKHGTRNVLNILSCLQGGATEAHAVEHDNLMPYYRRGCDK